MPQGKDTLSKIIGIAQIVTFAVTGIWVIANNNANATLLQTTVTELRATVAQLKGTVQDYGDRLIKLETRFDDLHSTGDK